MIRIFHVVGTIYIELHVLDRDNESQTERPMDEFPRGLETRTQRDRDQQPHLHKIIFFRDFIELVRGFLETSDTSEAFSPNLRASDHTPGGSKSIFLTPHTGFVIANSQKQTRLLVTKQACVRARSASRRLKHRRFDSD